MVPTVDLTGDVGLVHMAERLSIVPGNGSSIVPDNGCKSFHWRAWAERIICWVINQPSTDGP